MQSETKSRVDQITSPAGQPITVLRYEGDIASTSKAAVLGTYQALPKSEVKLILLDFTKVDYINSSGIAVIIQLPVSYTHLCRTRRGAYFLSRPPADCETVHPESTAGTGLWATG